MAAPDVVAHWQYAVTSWTSVPAGIAKGPVKNMAKGQLKNMAKGIAKDSATQE